MENTEVKPGAEPSAPRSGRPNLPSYQLTVVDSLDVEGHMRRVVLSLPDGNAFDYKPGQAIVMMIPTGNGEVGRRDYTIRAVDRDAGTISVDFFKHGDTPGPRWANGVKAGDTIDVKGPRGNTVFNPAAEWHLFAGDETCIPAIVHILENMPANTAAHVFIEVQDESGQVEVNTQADLDLRWLHRGEVPAGPGTFMADALEAFELPKGRGQAYIIGETSNVRRQRHGLIARGLTREQISSEGYWRPGRIGGHDHVND